MEPTLCSCEAAAEQEPLVVQVRQNTLTGKHGLIVTDGHGDILAELLSLPAGELTDEAKERANWLAWRASRGELSLVVHAPIAGSRVKAQAFVTVIRRTEVFKFEYLARLLLHERDIAQWEFGLDYPFSGFNPSRAIQ